MLLPVGITIGIITEYCLAGVAQLFRVRSAGGTLQGNLSDYKLVYSTKVSGSRNVTLLARPRKLLSEELNLKKIDTYYAGVAQLFRALPCQGRGQGLESPHPHQDVFEDPLCGFLFCLMKLLKGSFTV